MPKVLITGGSGYIGQNIVTRLLSDTRASIVLLSGKKSPREKKPRITYYNYDSTTFDIYDVMKKEKPDIVIHLAGYFCAEHTPADVPQLIDSNIRFGVQLLDAMAQAGVGKLINTGSYWERYRQDTAYHPVNLYAALKRAFEDVLQFYSEAHGLRTITMELYDIYGIGDTRNKLVPSLIRFMRDKSPFLMSPGRQYVDFVYISDVVNAYMAAMKYLVKSEAPVNERVAIGSGKPIRLDRFIKLFERVFRGSVVVEFGKRPYRKREVMHACADISKAKKLLGWKQTVTLEAGLRLLKSDYDHD